MKPGWIIDKQIFYGTVQYPGRGNIASIMPELHMLTGRSVPAPSIAGVLLKSTFNPGLF